MPYPKGSTLNIIYQQKLFRWLEGIVIRSAWGAKIQKNKDIGLDLSKSDLMRLLVRVFKERELEIEKKQT